MSKGSGQYKVVRCLVSKRGSTGNKFTRKMSNYCRNGYKSVKICGSYS